MKKGQGSVKKPLAVKKLPTCLARQCVDLTTGENVGGDKLNGRRRGVGKEKLMRDTVHHNAEETRGGAYDCRECECEFVAERYLTRE